MATNKQIAANRLNSQKSTGPQTSEGRRASRYNALKHGMYAEQLIMRDEKPEDLADLAAEYHEQYVPADPTARFLVDTLVHSEWRIRRLRKVETGLWRRAYNTFVVTSMVNEIDNDAANTCTAGDAFAAEPPIFERLQRIVNACQRDFHRALKELKGARAQAPASPQPQQSTPASAKSAPFRQTPETTAPAAPEAAKNPVFRPRPTFPTVDEMTDAAELAIREGRELKPFPW